MYIQSIHVSKQNMQSRKQHKRDYLHTLSTGIYHRRGRRRAIVKTSARLRSETMTSIECLEALLDD